jgi:xanthine/uracil permease
MEKTKEYTSPYEMDGRIPWPKAIVYGLQHVLAMFVGNLTPLIVICGACGIGATSDFASVYVELLQNAMIIAGVVTLVQLFAIGPVGGRVPIIMGTSSGFIGVFKSVAGVMGGGVIAYGAIMGASIIGGLFEGVLGFFLKPLRRFFPAVVTGTVVLSIGLSLISVGVSSFGGGSSAADYGSLENLFIGLVVLIIILGVKHFAKSSLSTCVSFSLSDKFWNLRASLLITFTRQLRASSKVFPFTPFKLMDTTGNFPRYCLQTSLLFEIYNPSKSDASAPTSKNV